MTRGEREKRNRESEEIRSGGDPTGSFFRCHSNYLLASYSNNCFLSLVFIGIQTTEPSPPFSWGRQLVAFYFLSFSSSHDLGRRRSCPSYFYQRDIQWKEHLDIFYLAFVKLSELYPTMIRWHCSSKGWSLRPFFFQNFYYSRFFFFSPVFVNRLTNTKNGRFKTSLFRISRGGGLFFFFFGFSRTELDSLNV